MCIIILFCLACISSFFYYYHFTLCPHVGACARPCSLGVVAFCISCYEKKIFSSLSPKRFQRTRRNKNRSLATTRRRRRRRNSKGTIRFPPAPSPSCTHLFIFLRPCYPTTSRSHLHPPPFLLLLFPLLSFTPPFSSLGSIVFTVRLRNESKVSRRLITSTSPTKGR